MMFLKMATLSAVQSIVDGTEIMAEALSSGGTCKNVTIRPFVRKYNMKEEVFEEEANKEKDDRKKYR